MSKSSDILLTKSSKTERVVKSYLCTKMNFPRVNGRLTVTNKRVIFHGLPRPRSEFGSWLDARVGTRKPNIECRIVNEVDIMVIGENLDHEEKIMRVRADRDKTIRTLHGDYHINVDQLPYKRQEVDQKISEIKNKCQELPDVQSLREQQHDIGQEYQVVWRREGARAAPDKNNSNADREKAHRRNLQSQINQ